MEKITSKLPPETYAHFILSAKVNADFDREWSKLCKWLHDGDALSITAAQEKREITIINAKLAWPLL